MQPLKTQERSLNYWKGVFTGHRGSMPGRGFSSGQLSGQGVRVENKRKKVSDIFGRLKTLLTFAPRRNGTGLRLVVGDAEEQRSSLQIRLNLPVCTTLRQEVVGSKGKDSLRAQKFIENIEKGKTRKVTQIINQELTSKELENI